MAETKRGMTWGTVVGIMEDLVDGSPNVRVLRIERAGKDLSPISQAERFSVTLGVTEHWQEVMSQDHSATFWTYDEAEVWVQDREEEGGRIDHREDPLCTEPLCAHGYIGPCAECDGSGQIPDRP